ncbi:hypothetical protein ACSEVU_26020 [Pseudomonas aeruginosa]
MSIDWSKAPKGTTHYHIAEDINPWRKIEGTVAYEHYRGKWLRVNSFNEGCMPGYYVPIPQETWNGQGLPPVGTVCEHYGTADDLAWLEVEVIGHGNVDGRNVAFFRYGTGSPRFTVSYSTANNFRPIRTPEQIAAEERRNSILHLANILIDSRGQCNEYSQAEAIFDAGYRRQEEGK